MYDNTCCADDGSIESPNLTENQYKYAEIISQIVKLAVFVSLRHSKFRVEAPNGFEKMMEQIKKDKKSYDTLTTEEKASYENRFLYETHSSQRLGNPSAVLQQLLHEAHEDKEIQEIMKKCLDDMKLNASKSTTKYVDSKNKRNLK